MPSLAVMAMPVELLLALRDGLTPPSSPHGRGRDRARAARSDPGFRGWHTVAGTGATAAASDAAADSAGAAASTPGATRDRVGMWDGPDGDAEAAKGLAFGYASARDARVAVYIILLWKCQLDAAALEAAGGCSQLKKVLLCPIGRARASNAAALCATLWPPCALCTHLGVGGTLCHRVTYGVFLTRAALCEVGR